MTRWPRQVRFAVEPIGTSWLGARRARGPEKILRALGICWSWIVLSLWLDVARAQTTTVQLPTYRTFTTRTTVSVPDRGSVYLGGIQGARSGSNQFGSPLVPFGNRAVGSQRSVASARVSVFIHDFEAMEEQILGCPPEALVRRSEGDASLLGDPAVEGRPAKPTPRQWVRTPALDPVLPSVEAIRAERVQEESNRQAEAEDWFRRGQLAEEAGKTHVARMFYQLAARRAVGSFKDRVQARLDALPKTQASRLAQTRPAR